MSPGPTQPPTPRRRWPALAVAALLVAAAVGGGLWAWRWQAPVPADLPDTVELDALRAALAPDPAMPLDAAHTDVVLVAACTLRRDRLEPYGHPGPTSPFLRLLADQGVVFEHNFSQAPWTRPAMGAIMTGRWPRALRLDNPGRSSTFEMVVGDEHTLLAEVLAGAGYRAVGSVANPNLKAMFGFAQGFDEYREPEGTYRENPYIPRSMDVVDDVLEMAAATPADQRLYARLVVLDGHKRRKYLPRYRKLFHSGMDDVDDYDAALRTIDGQLARLYVGLKALRPNLLFVLAADHGEGLDLPEHHGPEHGNHVYRSTVETPLLYQHPALPRPGRRVGGLGMNVDIHPTVLDLLGIPLDHPVDGRSQAAAVRGEVDEASHEVVFAETFFRQVHRSTAFDGEHQLVRDYAKGRLDGRRTDRLYAASDPGATVDVKADHPEATTALAMALDAWELHVKALSEAAVDAAPREVDAGTRKMLEELGYVEVEDGEGDPPDAEP